MNSTHEMSCYNDQNQWYVVHCKPRKEVYASNALRDLLGLTTFLPESCIRSRGEVRRVPFFPGYFFVRVNLLEVQLSLINASPGVLRLLAFDDCPQPVPHFLIKAIHEEVNRLESMGGLPGHDFCPGDLVRVKSGPLEGLETVFVGPITPSKRVRIFLNFLGGLKEVQIDCEALEKVCNSPTLQRERLTRGKGRRVNTIIRPYEEGDVAAIADSSRS